MRYRLLVCGWPFISHSLFHSFFSLFSPLYFFVYFISWLAEGIFGKQTILLYILPRFFLSSHLLPQIKPQPPPVRITSIAFFSPSFCCFAASSLGWWSNQCFNQTWAIDWISPELWNRSSSGNKTKHGKLFLKG